MPTISAILSGMITSSGSLLNDVAAFSEKQHPKSAFQSGQRIINKSSFPRKSLLKRYNFTTKERKEKSGINPNFSYNLISLYVTILTSCKEYDISRFSGNLIYLFKALCIAFILEGTLFLTISETYRAASSIVMKNSGWLSKEARQ